MNESIFLNPIDRVLFNEFKNKLPSNMAALYEGYGPKGFFTIYRKGIFFTEIAQIITNTKVRPYFRWYVSDRTRQMIQKIIDDSQHTLVSE